MSKPNGATPPESTTSATQFTPEQALEQNELHAVLQLSTMVLPHALQAVIEQVSRAKKPDIWRPINQQIDDAIASDIPNIAALIAMEAAKHMVVHHQAFIGYQQHLAKRASQVDEATRETLRRKSVGLSTPDNSTPPHDGGDSPTSADQGSTAGAHESTGASDSDGETAATEAPRIELP